MRKTASYLDSLNEGRQRRPQTSLEDLDRTLRSLEERIGRSRNSSQQQRRERQGSSPEETRRDTGSKSQSSSFRSLAHDIELARIQEKNVAAVESIAAELKSLRDELQHKMTAGIRAELDAFRSDINESYQAAQSAPSGNDLEDQIVQLAEYVQTLARRDDGGNVSQLRQEIDEIKQAISTLAREETVREFNERWNDLGRRWEAFDPSSLGQTDFRPEFDALSGHLETIGKAVDHLPESLPLKPLEEKLRIIAEAVEHLSQQQENLTPESLQLIEQRLDEISRAIVASSVSVQAAVPTAEPFERIEARISSLAQQLEEVAHSRSTDDLVERIGTLADRVDSLARERQTPPDLVDQLAGQIANLAEKVEKGISATNTDSVLQELERRYVHLAELVERQHEATEEQARTLVQNLESRLDALASREAGGSAEDQIPHHQIMDAIDERFTEIARRLETGSSRDEDSAMMQNLEARLEEISRQLEESGARESGMESDLLRSLESQIAGLNEHLSRPERVIPEYEDLAPRIKELEESIADSREQIFVAAREAAERAISSLPAFEGDNSAVTELAADLKAIEQLTRQSDERNARTFEAIHDTLLKVVDRLGTLEDVDDPGFHEPHKRLDVDETPPLQPSDLPDDGARRGFGPDYEDFAEEQTPAEADAVPSHHAMEDEEYHEESDDTSVMQDPAELVRAVDPKVANEPLEPGSGAPDLDSIINQVRNERGTSSNQEEAAKSDFIAAARRAAQAAAAEANNLAAGKDVRGSKGRFGILSLLQNKRKPIIIAASILLIALAGLQLGDAFLGSGTKNNKLADTPTADKSIASAPALDADAPGEARESMPAADEESSAVSVPPAPEMPEMAAIPPARPPEPVVEKKAMEPAPAMSEDKETAPPESASAADVEIGEVPEEAGPIALREAARSGDPSALYEIGTRYAEGRSVESSLEKAARWYQLSADMGFAPAQYRIGNFYEKGLGVKRDPANAMTWYQLAAEQGNASAMHNLAVLFAMGANGQPDNESAARWFLKAAELGVKDSQFNLGILSAKGVGLEQNLEESYKWFALAAKTGDKDAAGKRDEIANALRPDQLNKARAAVALWKARPLNPEANTVDVPDEWREDNAETAGIDMKKAVRNIQLILNKNGYDAGPADGLMGERTKSAIARFQEDNGMPATGEVDEALVRTLLAKK